MNLFVDYIQPLTNWLQNNPNWSLFITFLIALTESLAIIGSIIPGSVTMTAIGILAGSGIMRIDLTLLAAILGAVAGDSLSYILGYYYSERLIEIWPFNKYPKWIQYGKDFFTTHGGKSVLLGRFVGPLRSIIPVIAGILHMKHWRFFIANVLSAIGWSLLYVMPGVMIGAAGHELSTQTATNLFVLILTLLAVIWLFSFVLRWLFIQLNTFLRIHLHDLWMKLKNNAILIHIYNLVTPKDEKNHYPTASLTLLILLSLICFIILLILTVETNWLTLLNSPTYIFFKSFNSVLLSLFFIFCTQLTSSITLLIFFIISCFLLIKNKDFTAIIYLFSILVVSSLFAFLLNFLINSPRPAGLLAPMTGSSFPAFNLVVATALYGFILFYINNTYFIFTNTLKTIVFTILGLSGIGSIYLGDYWLTDILASYLSGTTICLTHCLIYRKANLKKPTHSLLMISPLLIGVLLSSLLSTYLNYKTLAYNHTLVHKEFSLQERTWWTQEKPVLPLYQLSRIGKRISLLNIQFVGDLDILQKELEKNGWKSHSDTFFTNLLTRMSKQSNGIKLPLLTQLYDDKPPVLIMTYTDQKTQSSLELRVWQSNYNLIDLNKQLWIGSIHPSTPIKKQMNNNTYSSKLINPLIYMFPQKNPFILRTIKLPEAMIENTRYATQPYIILIKEKGNSPHHPKGI